MGPAPPSVPLWERAVCLPGRPSDTQAPASLASAGLLPLRFPLQVPASAATVSSGERRAVSEAGPLWRSDYKERNLCGWRMVPHLPH